ncbi:MAG TPA: PP2C family protein-serine/threonine phosphatase, partial [Anaerolineales bacterium]|nr:PP2C family protein-serine/threonine phosphatase [Anaerolineales bacterium]
MRQPESRLAKRPAERKGVVRMATASHIGASPRRTLLEDRARAELITTAGGLQMVLGVVADGIGGENAGERAAELTVQTVIDHSRASNESNVPRLLEQALQEANQRVFAESQKSRRKTNMGSTAAVAAIVDGRLYLANAGDSRVYLLRGRKVLPLT